MMRTRSGVVAARNAVLRHMSSSSSSSGASKPKVVVFGGNGFVGQRVCENALKLGATVLSVNRSGEPRNPKPWTSQVQWVRGDALKPETYREVLQGATGVVSCVGGFGSNQKMERVNGDANVAITIQSKSAGVKNLVFVSATESNLPDAVLRGYFHGKRRTEDVILTEFPSTGTVLRPSAIYGVRDVGSMRVNLGWVLKPMKALFQLPPFPRLRNMIPGFKALLAPPVSVDDVGLVAAAAALGKTQAGVLSEADIEQRARELAGQRKVE